MITFFTHCRPFVGIMADVQRTAIASWQSIGKNPQIILMGDASVKDAANQLGVEYFEHVEKNKWGTARVDSIFAMGDHLAKHDIMVEVSADIVLSSTLLMAIEGMRHIERPFVVGERWDLNHTGEDINTGNVVRHGPSAVDYFLYRRGTLGDIPPFGVGRTAYDPWLMWAAKERWDMTVIDATETIFAVHLAHPYIEYGNKEAMLASEERAYNHTLAKETGCKEWLNIDKAPYVMKRGIITLR